MHYLPTSEGGRTTPAVSGSSPAIEFPFRQRRTPGIQQFTETDIAFPGDTLTASVTLLQDHDILDQLYEGLGFDFYEGEKRIGHGIIKKITGTFSKTS